MPKGLKQYKLTIRRIKEASHLPASGALHAAEFTAPPPPSSTALSPVDCTSSGVEEKRGQNMSHASEEKLTKPSRRNKQTNDVPIQPDKTGDDAGTPPRYVIRQAESVRPHPSSAIKSLSDVGDKPSEMAVKPNSAIAKPHETLTKPHGTTMKPRDLGWEPGEVSTRLRDEGTPPVSEISQHKDEGTKPNDRIMKPMDASPPQPRDRSDGVTRPRATPAQPASTAGKRPVKPLRSRRPQPSTAAVPPVSGGESPTPSPDSPS